MPHASPPEQDPGLPTWALTLLFWGECLVATIAALAGSRSNGESLCFAAYAGLLGLVALLRSGVTSHLGAGAWLGSVIGLGCMAVMHALPWLTPLGRQSPRLVEGLCYGLLVGGGAWVVARERAARRSALVPEALEDPQPQPVSWSSRASDAGLGAVTVGCRALGLIFLAGPILVSIDPLLRLPFSSH